MIPATLAKIEEDLRRTVGYRLFPEAGRLIIDFCSTAAEEMNRFPAGHPERRGLVLYVEEVLDWTQRMLSAARAYQVAEIHRLSLLDRYLRDRPTGLTSLRLDG